MHDTTLDSFRQLSLKILPHFLRGSSRSLQIRFCVTTETTRCWTVATVLNGSRQSDER